MEGATTTAVAMGTARVCLPFELLLTSDGTVCHRSAGKLRWEVRLESKSGICQDVRGETSSGRGAHVTLLQTKAFDNCECEVLSTLFAVSAKSTAVASSWCAVHTSCPNTQYRTYVGRRSAHSVLTRDCIRPASARHNGRDPSKQVLCPFFVRCWTVVV